jgi:hypothetical protein
VQVGAKAQQEDDGHEEHREYGDQQLRNPFLLALVVIVVVMGPWWTVESSVTAGSITD